VTACEPKGERQVWSFEDLHMTLKDVQAQGGDAEPVAGASEVGAVMRVVVRKIDISHRWKRRAHVASTSSPTPSSQGAFTRSAVNASVR
jgi:hypothetical protein